MTFLSQQLPVFGRDGLALKPETMTMNFLILQLLKSRRGSSISLAGGFLGPVLVVISGSSAQVFFFSSANVSVNCALLVTINKSIFAYTSYIGFGFYNAEPW